jgi:hypothetical protein
MDKFLKSIAIISIILAVIVVVGEICNTKDRIIKRTADDLYVMEYSLYDLDSTVHKYKTTKTYVGIISDKDKSSHLVGIVGKGGYCKKHYNVIIKFNNTETKVDDRELFNKYNIGDKVQVTESWYPYHKITIK